MNKLLNIILLSSVVVASASMMHAMQPEAQQDADLAAAIAASLADQEAKDAQAAADASLEDEDKRLDQEQLQALGTSWQEAYERKQTEQQEARERAAQERKMRAFQEREAREKAILAQEEAARLDALDAQHLELAKQISLEPGVPGSAIVIVEPAPAPEPAPRVPSPALAPIALRPVGPGVAVAVLQPARPGFFRRLFTPSLTKVGIVGLVVGIFYIVKNKNSQ